MGHSRMLLAVAGLQDKEVERRADLLASGNWSYFSEAERLAFAFSYKLSKHPAALEPIDLEGLRLRVSVGIMKPYSIFVTMGAELKRMICREYLNFSAELEGRTFRAKAWGWLMSGHWFVALGDVSGVSL